MAELQYTAKGLDKKRKKNVGVCSGYWEGG